MSTSMDKLRAKAKETMGGADARTAAREVLSGGAVAASQPPAEPAPPQHVQAVPDPVVLAPESSPPPSAPKPKARRSRAKKAQAAAAAEQQAGAGLGFASLKPPERRQRGDGTRRKPMWRDRDQTWLYHTSFYLPEALDQEIEEVRERYGITRQAMLEHAVRRLLEEERQMAEANADAAE